MTAGTKQLLVEPIISCPRAARPGETYLMSIDLRAAPGSAWPYDDEEYVVHCAVDTLPLFENEPIGAPAVVMHRFGSYGPATFLLTASPEEGMGTIRVILSNAWGVPVQSLEVGRILVTRETPLPEGRVVIAQPERADVPHDVLPSGGEAIEPREPPSTVPPLTPPLESYRALLVIAREDDRYRVELIDEDKGVSVATSSAPPLPSLQQHHDFLRTGGLGFPAGEAESIGREVEQFLFAEPELRRGWLAILHNAREIGRSVLLAIAADVDFLPFGLLYDSHTSRFLFRSEPTWSPVRFVRVVRGLPPRSVSLRRPIRVLVAVAEPRDISPFEAAHNLATLAVEAHNSVDVYVCTTQGAQPLWEALPGSLEEWPREARLWDPEQVEQFCRTTPAALRRALESNACDILHLAAHARGDGVLLADTNERAVLLPNKVLTEWCASSKLSLAFLQICGAGRTDESGGAGLAETLLRPGGGNLAAVVASAFPLDARQSTAAAVAFYRRLARGEPLEVALDRGEELPLENWSWALLELWKRPPIQGESQDVPTSEQRSPYPGPVPFEEKDADLFFGREAEVADLLNLLRDEVAVIVVGDAGNGKTSLLRAGLVPAVRRHGLNGRTDWTIVSFRLGANPVESLVAGLLAEKDPALTLPPADGPYFAIRQALDSVCSPQRPLFLIVDQFEDLFTLCQDERQRRAVAAELADCPRRHADHFRLVLAVRTDFLKRVAELPEVATLIQRPWVLRPLAPHRIEDIVAGPAAELGYRFEGPRNDGHSEHAQSLLGRILSDPFLKPSGGERSDLILGLAEIPHPTTSRGETSDASFLPVLQSVLHRLWAGAAARGSKQFTHADYDRSKDLARSIGRYADAVYESLGNLLGTEGQALAKTIFLSLVTLDGIRGLRSRPELEAATGDPNLARQVIDYLAGYQLLVVDHAPRGGFGAPLVEIAHDAVLSQWPRLRQWLEQDFPLRALREAFEADCRRWQDGMPGIPPRSREGLPSRERARQYVAWVSGTRPALTKEQREFAAALIEPSELGWLRWLLRWMGAYSTALPSQRPPDESPPMS